jgi:hypothetical protein
MAYTKLQALRAAAVTPSDTANIPNVALQSGDPVESSSACSLFVGTGGTLVVRTAGGDDVTLLNIADGTFLPIQVVRVFATGTTAAGILALW